MIRVFDLGPVGNGRLATMARPSGGDWLEDELRGLDGKVDHVVCMLTRAEAGSLGLSREAEACAKLGLGFSHVPLPDRTTPASSREFLKFVEALSAELANGRSVATHCRAGIGRSSLMAASLLVAHGVAPADAWSRIAAARGCMVPDTTEQRDWLHDFAAYLAAVRG